MSTTQQPADPAPEGDGWKQRRRHWHCYADEVRLDEEIDYEGRRARAVAMTPGEVVTWMTAEAGRVLPRLVQERRLEAERLRTDETLREVHLATLSQGRSTGMCIAISDRTVLRLYAHSVGPVDVPEILSRTPAICAQHHEGDANRVTMS
jgi:hypothetical protein